MLFTLRKVGNLPRLISQGRTTLVSSHLSSRISTSTKLETLRGTDLQMQHSMYLEFSPLTHEIGCYCDRTIIIDVRCPGPSAALGVWKGHAVGGRGVLVDVVARSRDSVAESFI